jgi:hypothetical protein
MGEKDDPGTIQGIWAKIWMQRRSTEIHVRLELDMGRSGRHTGDLEEVQRDSWEIERDKVRETHGR